LCEGGGRGNNNNKKAPTWGARVTGEKIILV